MTVFKSRYKIFRPVMVSSSGVSSKNRSLVVVLCINIFILFYSEIYYLRNATVCGGIRTVIHSQVFCITVDFVFVCVFSLLVFTHEILSL